MKEFLKKNTVTILIVVATLVLAGIAIFTAVRLYQLRQKAVAPTAPESRPRAATEQKTQTVVIEKFPEFCQEKKKRESGQSPKQQGINRRDQDFSVDPNCTINGATIISGKPQKYLYDDFVYVLLDDKVVIAENVAISGSPLELGGTWDWDTVRGRAYHNHNKTSAIVCFGNGQCSGPSTRAGKDSTKQINATFSVETLNLVLSQGNDHTFSAVVAGNLNAKSDCNLTEDLTLTLDLTCEVDALPQCSDGIDNDGDGFIDCTPGAEDPGCYPDGNGHGICNPDDDDETDIPSLCQLSFTIETPDEGDEEEASPTPTATASATPAATASPSPTGTAAPELPEAGTSTPTLIGLGVGIIILLFSVVLAL